MSERNVPLAEVRDLLAKAEQDRGELTYEQKLAFEHSKKFGYYTLEQVNKLIEELTQNPKIDVPLAVRIADLAPHHGDDVRALFAKVRVPMSDADVQKILDTVAKYKSA